MSFRTALSFMLILYVTHCDKTLFNSTCMNYIHLFPDYRCTRQKPFYENSRSLAFKVSKSAVQYVMKVNPNEESSKMELEFLKRLRDTKYLPNLFDSEELDNNIIIIITSAKYQSLLECIPEMPSKFSDPRFILKLFDQILEGVMNIHKNLLVHTDIRPENILITEDLTPLIVDYDTAVNMSSTSFARGSPVFMAPEALYAMENKLNVVYDEKIDVFSLGALFYYLYYQRLPMLKSLNYEELVNSTITFSPKTPKFVIQIIEGSYTVKDYRMNMDALRKIVKKALTKNTYGSIGYEYSYKLNSNRRIQDDYFYRKNQSFIFVLISLVVLIILFALVIIYKDKLSKFDVGVEIKEEDIEQPMKD